MDAQHDHTEDLQQLRDQLRAEIREARETLKDLRRETRDARTLIPLLTDELFTAEVKKQVDALAKVTDQAMRSSVEKVTKSFDDLADTLTGQDRASRRKGKTPLPELFRAKAVLDAARDEQHR
jgi:uncharacterized membrane protein